MRATRTQLEPDELARRAPSPNTPYRMTPTMLAAVAVSTGIHQAARSTESWRPPTR